MLQANLLMHNACMRHEAHYSPSLRKKPGDDFTDDKGHRHELKSWTGVWLL